MPKRGVIHLGQFRLGFGTGSNSNFTFPIAFTYSNRTELIVHPTWGVQFGITYNLNSLFSSSGTAIAQVRRVSSSSTHGQDGSIYKFPLMGGPAINASMVLQGNAAASTYKFSPETMLGELIEIEERDPSYVLGAPKIKKLRHFTVRNPAFDVTSPQDIDLIITERGVIPPQAAIMIVREQKGVSVS